MRQDVKDLADAMERGWKLLPKMSEWYFESPDEYFDQDNFRAFKITCACAQGHALLGTPAAVGVPDRHKFFPILRNQLVKFRGKHPYSKSERSLEYAINTLIMDDKWTTPQVIAWLRSHQED
jgi:hypothetical protein